MKFLKRISKEEALNSNDDFYWIESTYDDDAFLIAVNDSSLNASEFFGLGAYVCSPVARVDIEELDIDFYSVIE